jgi:predicted Zn-dependent protease
MCSFARIAIWGDEANKEDVKMATQQTVQQVMDFLKSHPEAAKRAADYMRSHPNEVKEALRDVADERGWDLSKIDTAALKAEISKIAH